MPELRNSVHCLRVLGQDTETKTRVDDSPPIRPATASSPSQSDLEVRVDQSVRHTSISVDEARTFSEGERCDPSADQFHGPTSAIFDTRPQERRTRRQSAAIPDDYQKGRLLTETVKQRHLEQINLRRSTFDFGHITTQQGMTLLTMFWNRQHATGSVVYRPSFMRDMAAGGTCSPIIIGFEDSQDGSRAASLPFRRKFEQLLFGDYGQTACKSKITTIQALLLMSDVLFAWLDERSVAWQYLGIAINMIVDLGMHSERGIVLSADFQRLEWLETRRRVFWAAFILDKIQSIYQGRPTRLRSTDCSVPALFLDEFEEFEPFKTDGYSLEPSDLGCPTYKKYHQSDELSMNEICQSLQEELTQWRESLPAHLSIPAHAYGTPVLGNSCEALPHTLSLLSMFHALTILLHRPFIFDARREPTAQSASKNSLDICNKAALDIDTLLRLYKSKFCMTAPPYFITYATYASGTIHMRIASQQSRDRETAYEPLAGLYGNELELGEWPTAPELLFDAYPLFGFQAPDFDGVDGFGGL
ncbi:fungal-specific transcription factor domain-containing protein [Stachybotrys elegans]|uniref:Fungal-specific transcription factor domain-containing protein n=1 Tax=Stachybotrys elegans TaxID=80388 RepID=A0A8K0WV97_9HYPO|nr:fungal-specific transcription factor domain-containing protein [Stachybotrys elegans]